ncbi:hypothetical protein [Methylovorus glucosotrophus]|uniref:ApeA N-terminal domain-containing protein n=1 Tax=Methylovorus glucosotrophus (strain SIP3-4) TaxID=582744 RepID=C6XDU9_METGS|nr:hypothetical protein [Methylovorus glucosotrophus]ACT50724.1 hypothetical protein Msip34_1479 [Methylovorus glucosotrophus SIP3-4]
MKNYQDTETGGIWAFEGDYDPFSAGNRNIPKTLTALVQPKPDESHVWYQGRWIKQEDAPPGYTPPISSVPSYNPAWMVHMRPYTAVHRGATSGLVITLEQINSNSYDGSKLAEVVTTLPLNNTTGLSALVSYDGTIAIPQCTDYPSKVEGVRKLNEILCSILLGGIHAEVLHAEELIIGALLEKTKLANYTPSLHASLRSNWAGPNDRLLLLMPSRVLMVEELHSAYTEGHKVLQTLDNFTPFFLLSGYTSMVYRNNSDALSNLWIVVEQLTEHLWVTKYMKHRSSFPDFVTKAYSEFKRTNSLGRISTKHELLYLSNVLSAECHEVLNIVRGERNDLAHRGIVPSSKLIEDLWSVLPELLEVCSGIESIGLRRLYGGVVENWGVPHRTNFDEWMELAGRL